jgi:hypothetical protein
MLAMSWEAIQLEKRVYKIRVMTCGGGGVAGGRGGGGEEVEDEKEGEEEEGEEEAERAISVRPHLR